MGSRRVFRGVCRNRARKPGVQAGDEVAEGGEGVIGPASTGFRPGRLRAGGVAVEGRLADEVRAAGAEDSESAGLESCATAAIPGRWR